MHSPTVSEGVDDKEKLTLVSPLRLEVEAEVIRFISKYIEDSIPGYGREDYHVFVIAQIGQRYADWFERLCISGMTEDRFRELYVGKAFQAIVNFSQVKYPLEYLRNIVDAFTVPNANRNVASVRAEIAHQLAVIREDI